MADGIYKNFYKKYHKIGQTDPTEDDFIKRSRTIILDLVLPNFDFLTPHYIKEFLNIFILELRSTLDEFKKSLKKLFNLKIRNSKDVSMAFLKIWTTYLEKVKFFNVGFEYFFNKTELKSLKVAFSQDHLVNVYKSVLLSFVLNDNFKVTLLFI
jgi:hypothetical protein